MVEVEKRQLPIDVVLGSFQIHIEHIGRRTGKSGEDTTAGRTPVLQASRCLFETT
jgi:hypothetical protein